MKLIFRAMEPKSVDKPDTATVKMPLQHRLREAKNWLRAFTIFFQHVNKSAIREAIITQLRAELARQTSAALLARDEAISEESRAENKYDTHSQEAAYLAEGQARQAAAIGASLAHNAALPLPEFSANDAISLGALVE